MSIKIGICGVGSFANSFIPLFKAYPQVAEVILCDLDAVKLKEKAERFGVSEVCSSLDQLCRTDVDAIALFTQHHLHGPQAVQALQNGKHVYSAVPPAVSLPEITELIRTVEQTGKIYMLGETSYYYPCAIYCRQRFGQGDFGAAVYAEAEYYHDYSHGLYQVAQWRHGSEWEKYYGKPPLFYPTHSVSMVVSVTKAYATHVCGMGVVDRHEDNLFSMPVKTTSGKTPSVMKLSSAECRMAVQPVSMNSAELATRVQLACGYTAPRPAMKNRSATKCG